MSEIMDIKPEPKIYLAPLQGFTDFVYRKVFAEIFDTVDAYFVPYISVKNNQILRKYEKEFLLQNNPQKRVIPQVLPKDPAEILFLSKILENAGYNEINLNLGCPYPMVTNREKGAGLLISPEKIENILSAFFEKSNLQLSVKMRAGLISPDEIERVLPVLNQFPLKEVIVHPRVAKQLYSGEILDAAFLYATKNLKHKLVYNGDIFSLNDFQNRKEKFPETRNWMIGRGILMNPFLPSEIKNYSFSETEKREKLQEFHHSILENYMGIMDNTGNVLNKMKQFWSYFSYNFENPQKSHKWIKKTNNFSGYHEAVHKIFSKINS